MDPLPPEEGGGPIAPPPECTAIEVTQCVPKYMLSCTVAADCGEGFECVPEQQCSCPGSSGSGGGTDTGGATPGSGGMVNAGDPAMPIAPPEETECTCTNGPTSYCKPLEVPCAAASDCPAGWSCTEVGGSATCGAATPSSDPASGGAANGGAAEPAPPPECTETPGEMLCVPPYYGGRGGVSLGSDDRGESGGQGGASTGGPTSGEPPTTAPNPADPSDGDTSKSSASSGDDGGCQMGSGPAGGSGASLLALLGLAGILRRRRAA
jgi:MYXO-CTERM domain-containing protein